MSTSDYIVSAADEHVHIHAWSQFVIDDTGVHRFFGEFSWVGLVVGHSVFRDDISLVVDSLLGDHMVWCSFGVWDAEGIIWGRWE